MAISFAVLKEPNASRIFYGQLLSQICDKMMTLGLVWIISGMGSLKQVPWFLAMGALPHLLLSRWSGSLINRFGLLRTVILTDAFRGLIFFAAAAYWWLSPPSTEKTLPLFFLMTLFANCASALFNPAIMTLPMQLSSSKENLVGQLTAMIDSCFSMGNILGPVAAALLYPRLGLAGLFLLNGLSYFLAAYLESKIHLSPAPDMPLSGPVETTKVKTDSVIKFMLITFFFMNLVLTPMFAFLPLFAKFLFQGGIGILASLEFALGLGTVAGGLMLTVVTGNMKIGQRTILGSFTVSLAYLFFSLNHNPLFACIALFILGLSLSMVNISLLTFFQIRPPQEDVPRVMSLVNLISVGALPFSMVLVGGIIEKINMQTIAIVCACAFLGLTLITTFNHGLRRA